MGSVVNVRLRTPKYTISYDGLHYQLLGQQCKVYMRQGSLELTKAAAEVFTPEDSAYFSNYSHQVNKDSSAFFRIAQLRLV